MEENEKKDLEKSESRKNRRIVVGVCSVSALLALATILCVGFKGNAAINGSDTVIVSSNNGISSKGDSTTSSKSSDVSNSSNGDDSSSSSDSKGDDKDNLSSSQSGGESISSSSSSSNGDSSSSSSGSSKGSDSSSSSTSSSSTHVHTFGTTLEVITEATATEVGTKGYKCTGCEVFDTEHIVEYSPFMDNFDWNKALFGDSTLADNAVDYSHATDYTMKIDAFEYSGSSEIKDQYITDAYQKYGNIVYKNHKSYTSSLSTASKEESSYELVESYFQIMDDGTFNNYYRYDEKNTFNLRISEPGYDDFRKRGGEFNLKKLNDSVSAVREKFAKENFQYDAAKGTYSSSFNDFTPVEYEGALSGTIILGFDNGKLVSLDYSYTCSAKTGFNYEVKASVAYSAKELTIPTNITEYK